MLFYYIRSRWREKFKWKASLPLGPSCLTRQEPVWTRHILLLVSRSSLLQSKVCGWRGWFDGELGQQRRGRCIDELWWQRIQAEVGSGLGVAIDSSSRSSGEIKRWTPAAGEEATVACDLELIASSIDANTTQLQSATTLTRARRHTVVAAPKPRCHAHRNSLTRISSRMCIKSLSRISQSIETTIW